MIAKSQQFSGKLESAEGVIETLAAADAKTQVYTPKFKIDPETSESDPARTAGGGQPKLIGNIAANMSFQVRMRGSGVVTTDPDWIKYLKPCGFASSLLKSINIGAITGGPFLHGETITGTSSGAHGRVVYPTANGVTKIYYVSVGTGEFQSGETITGGTSGATTTTSSVPSSVGREWKTAAFSSASSISMGFNQDQYFEKLKGARGSAKFSILSGKPGLIDFNFQGADGGQSDAVFFTGVQYENTVPPAFKNATVLLDSYHPKLNSLEFDLGMKLSQRVDPEDPTGVLSFALSGRLITGTLNIEMMAASVFDLRAKFLAGTEIVGDFSFGTTPSRFRLYFPRIQIIGIDKPNEEGLVAVALQFQANGSMDTDDDFVITQL